MLVLSRKENEEIIIDGNIRITVVEITKKKVRIGITAPKSVSIVRKEIANVEPEKTDTDLPAIESR